MSPLSEVDMLSLTMAAMCVLKRIASGVVVKSLSKELSQFSEAKIPCHRYFGTESRSCARKAKQIGAKSASIALVATKIIDKRLFPYLNG